MNRNPNACHYLVQFGIDPGDVLIGGWGHEGYLEIQRDTNGNPIFSADGTRLVTVFRNWPVSHGFDFLNFKEARELDSKENYIVR